MAVTVPEEDAVFDAVYPAWIRRLSRHFWTPVAVARRAAELLECSGAHRVLDVGAGAGKFVLTAARAAPRLEWVGVEHRPHLVEAARRAHARLAVPNARFCTGDVTTTSWTEFDAFYFFNPLAENLFAHEDQIDDQAELTAARFIHDVHCVEGRLREARLGTLIVSYHSATVRIPGSYELEASEPAGTDWLRLWRKHRERDGGAFFVEAEDGKVWHSRSARLAVVPDPAQFSTAKVVDHTRCGRRTKETNAPGGTPQTAGPLGTISGVPTTSAPGSMLTARGKPVA
jgi:SAM-dependent methyltransferase